MRRTRGIWLLMLVLLSCSKGEGYVPDVPVNYSVTITTFGIKAINGILWVPDEGIAGLLIVRNATGYKAYDRCSTVNPQDLCKIVADTGGITVTDPCTGAKWLLMDGSPQKAPAVHYLKSYTVRLQGNQIQVTN